MRSVPQMPARRGAFGLSRGRMALIVLAIALFVLLTSLRGIAGFYTDYLWFDSLGLSGVWSGVLGAKIALAVIFTALFFAVMWLNLWIADRVGPRFRPAGPEEEVIERYRELVGNRAGLVRIVVSALLALLAGVGVSSQWNEWILFQNSVEFGTPDPLHGVDLGFYVFRLPFLSFLVDWAFAAFVIVLIVTAIAHYLNGGIRFQTPGQRVTPQVKAHLSVLLGVLALFRTADYWLQRYELNFSNRGVVDGASFTDVNAQLPALNLLVIISVAAAILFLVNIRLRGWVLPVIAVGLWGFVSLVVATLYPAFVQRFRVEPAESEKEAPYIERNIEATRAAFGVDDVEIRPFAATDDLTAADLEQNAETIRNIRLWEPDILASTYQRLQEVRGFYRFNDVDVDRYEIDGNLTQVVLSARELKPEGLPNQSWETKVLAYTHGYGMVLSPANAVTSDGQPDFIVKDVPPQGTPEITQPAIYYGEELPSYAIVDSARQEIDYVSAEGERTSTYDGDGGVGIGSYLRRVAFSLRFGDINPLISNFIQDDSKILYIRDIRDRVEAAAPFLEFDADPYPVVLDGRIFWIIDAYTTTSNYPYSQRAETDRVPSASGLDSSFNYVRNSVKVVVDAYHGSMRFYVVDESDPIVNAYRKAFPELFTSGDEVPDELRAHFRYPEDLFRVQTNMWGRYHIDDPLGFFSQSDGWNISQDPGSGAVSGQPNTQQAINPDGTLGPARERRMDPYYLLMRLPNEEDEEFLILQNFVPVSEDDTRRELTAFMIAKSSPGGEFGKLEVFVMPRDQQVDGPAIVDARIHQETDVAREISLLNQQGSSVLQGNLLVIPVEQSLLYIRPLYVQAEGTRVPELKRVVVVFGNRVVMRDSLEEALAEMFGDSPPTNEERGDPPDESEDPTGDVVQSVLSLLEQANRAFAEAETALRNGDLATYQQKVREAEALVQRAREASSPQSTTTTTEPAAASA